MNESETVSAAARRDWDFSRVADSELEACLMWELALEWQESFDRLHEYDQAVEFSPDWAMQTDPDEHTGIQNAAVLSRYAWQLDTPWQSLRKEFRAELASELSPPLF